MIKKYIRLQILENENLELVGKKTNSVKKIVHNDSTTKNTPNPTQFFFPLVAPMGPKNRDIVEKSPYWASVVRALSHSNLIKNCQRTLHANMHLAPKLCNQVRSLDHFVVQNSGDFLW